MSLIQKITPINLEEEKAKFFADLAYNPQFVYREPISEKLLYRYGKPKSAFVELAKEIIDKAFHNRNELDLIMMDGKLLTKDQVTKRTNVFLRAHELNNRFKIIWSSSYTALASITLDTVKYRLPCRFRNDLLNGVLYHEIGTHAIRRINYEKQPWFAKKEEYGFSNYLETEEGLASLHKYLAKKFKLAHVSAKRYYYCYLAKTMSFAELFKIVKHYSQDKEMCWNTTMRAKRGLADTSLPGGFTKDLLYLEGMVKVWNWLSHHHFNPTDLYLGKISMADVEHARTLNPSYKPLLPFFYKSDPDAYAVSMNEIAQTNYFEMVSI